MTELEMDENFLKKTLDLKLRDTEKIFRITEMFSMNFDSHITRIYRSLSALFSLDKFYSKQPDNYPESFHKSVSKGLQSEKIP